MESDDIVLIKSVLKEKGFYSNSEKFPKVAVHMDKKRKILSVKKQKKLVLYKYSNLVNSNGELKNSSR